jgi:hypothetical protein
MRRFLLLLLLYVAADFANPLMPGAVRFDAGEINVVQGDRSVRPVRPESDPARLVAVLPAGRVLLEATPLDRSAPRPLLVSLLLALRTVRRTPARHFVAQPSPSGDH